MPISTDNCNSFFETGVWLNVVANDRWERIEIKKKDATVEAAFPIVRMHKYGCKVLSNPPFTQTMGIYFENTGAKTSKKLEKEKKQINRIIEKLPKGFSYDFYLDVNNSYVLPFLWKGFEISPCFTYRLEDINDLDEVWKGLKDNIRTDIRKANKTVRIVNSDPDTLYDLQEKVFVRQGRHFPYSRDIIRDICKALEDHDALELIGAADDGGNIHAAALFVYDDNRCYYLMSGADPNCRNNGATSLLVWEGIKRASNRGIQIFDFEGSMIEDIERFDKAFGASPRVYYHVMKYQLLYKVMDSTKKKVKRILGYK